MNEISIFENKDYGFKIQGYIGNNGQMYVNIENLVRCIKGKYIQVKNNKEYLRLTNIKADLDKFGFPIQNGKDFIPESAMYLLIMNGDGKLSKQFQLWLAQDVIPEIRKSVQMSCSNNQLQNIPTDLVVNQITQLQNNDVQLAQSIQTTNTVLQSLNNCMKNFTTNIQDYVADSINSKDLQIDKISEMVGIRSKQTKMLTEFLKDKLSDILGYKVMASDNYYKRTKMNILHYFKVYLWEDICVQKFNEVHAYIDNLEREDIIGF